MRRSFALLLLFFALDAVAQEKPLVTLDLVKSGTMLLKTDKPGFYVPAPAVSTDVDIRVRGMILRGEVTQRFRNAEATCVEAVYAFPLPETAAVDRLRMKIGDRVIEGQIRERGEAEKVYEEAKEQGQHASLVSQERPNLFTASIANIAAGEEVVVTIGYQQTVDYRDGAFSFRFPTAIGPRYTPAHSAESAPVIESFAVGDSASKFTMKIDLDAGVPLRIVDAKNFKAEATTLSSSHYLFNVASAPGDRDFELVWQPQLGSEPQTAFFREGAYGLLMLVPPAVDRSTRLPKESTFIIDTSGSMAGPSLESAKKALLLALDRLSPRDRFNVIEFNSETTPLFDAPRPATAGVVADAKRWVESLESTGGTEMLPALQAALRDDMPQDDGVVRQVVFMTDGDVANESDLFSFIRSHLGRSRLFTVGIGAAPNSHFMRNAARFGRGTFTYIAASNEVQEKMTALFEKLETPVLTNVEVRFDDPAAEMWPQRVPDLYAGEPVIVAVKFASAAGRVIASGKIVNQEWHDVDVIPSVSEESGGGVARLWARSKIESLLDDPKEDTRAKVTELALEHHIVTQYTSLVAVDVTPASAVFKACETRAVPANLPAGWGGIDGSLPRTATPAPLLMLAGALFIAIAVGVRMLCALR